MSSRSAEARGEPGRSGSPAWKLSTRLTLLSTLSATLVVIGAALLLDWYVARDLRRDDALILLNLAQSQLTLLGEPVAGGVPARPAGEQLAAWQPPPDQAEPNFLRLLDGHGQLLVETAGFSALLAPERFPPPVANLTAGAVLAATASDGRPLLIASVRVPATATTSTRVLQLALDISLDQALINRYRGQVLMVVVASLLLSAAISAVLVRRALTPLEEITRSAERITVSRLNQRLGAARRPPELAALAAVFDAMLARLEDSFRRLSDFSSAMAHELRTPIGILTGEAEVALSRPRRAKDYREVIESSLEEYRRLARMIDNLLFVARADSGSAWLATVPLDARREAEAVAELYQALAEEREVAFSCHGEATVAADSDLLRRALSNLLSNAFRHTPAGGQVQIRIDGSDPRWVRIEVRDSGCGIGAEHLDRVFDRFYRADPARAPQQEGSGIGLSIVRSIMELHGGQAELESTPGQGTRVRLSFPAQPPGAMAS